MTLTSHIKKAFIAFTLFAVAIGAYFTFAPPHAQALESLDNIESGDLIRGEAFAAVYYMGADGLRYVFPNQKTYDTWYDNFDNVKFISDSDLGKIGIGGNATYRPGVRMIKIESDNRTYAVAQGGILRHVSSEDVAVGLYGADWNQMIDDVPDGFFTNYTIGDEVAISEDFDPAGETAAVASINVDKSLTAPIDVSLTDSGFSPIDVTIDAGDNIRFTNNGTSNHSATGDGLSWGTGTVLPGESDIVTFDEPGTYTFFDSYDSANTGAIYVE
jgi:plastocyanin